ncbi:hypothetical protein Gotur_026968 [Gossypium turneri]
MIAITLPGGHLASKIQLLRIYKMRIPPSDSFVIQVRGSSTQTQHQHPNLEPQPTSLSSKLNFSAMKLFNRFRKILVRLLFSLPSAGSSGTSSVAPKQKNCDRFEPPKTSCSSSYYSSHSHYTEAISDCIEFFNKSSQEGSLDGPKSDVSSRIGLVVQVATKSKYDTTIDQPYSSVDTRENGGVLGRFTPSETWTGEELNGNRRYSILGNV